MAVVCLGVSLTAKKVFDFESASSSGIVNEDSSDGSFMLMAYSFKQSGTDSGSSSETSSDNSEDNSNTSW